MTENFVILPDDSSNTGKLVRSNQRTVNGSNVEEHFMILQDYTSDNQAKIDSDGKLNIAGSISSMPQVTGSVHVVNQISEVSVGSNSWIKGGSMHLYSGTNYTNSVQQGTWNINNISTGSVRVISQADTSRTITNRVAGSIVDLPNVTLNNPSTIGSYTTQSITGSVNLATNLASIGSHSGQGNASITGSLEVFTLTGSVETYGTSVSVGSESYIKGGSIEVYTGSIHVNNFSAGTGYAGSDAYVVAGSVSVTNMVGSLEVFQTTNADMQVQATQEGTWTVGATLGSTFIYNRVAGSIVNLPDPLGSVYIATDLASIGSHSGQGNASLTGSLEVFSSTGSVEVYGSLSATAGSESYIKGGSVELYNLGSNAWVYLNSGTSYINVVTGSIHVDNFAAGTGYAGSDAYIPAGSVTVTSLAGSVEVFSSTGSVEIYGSLSATAGSESYIKGGSIHLYSGTSYINIPNVVATSGTVNLGTQADNITTLLGSTSIYNRVAGSIVNLPEVTIGTITAGSVEIYHTDDKPMPTEQSRGAFGFSGATLIASGTASVIISPGAGSKVFLKGFNASAETASQFRILFSGGTVINTFNLPSSGTVAMNLLGMEPSGATNQPIAVGMSNNGSLHFTAMTEDSL